MKDFIELYHQALETGIKIDRVIVATGSAGTQAALVAGAKALGNQTKIVVISLAGDKASVRRDVAQIANATAVALDSKMTFTPEESSSSMTMSVRATAGSTGRPPRALFSARVSVQTFLADLAIR